MSSPIGPDAPNIPVSASDPAIAGSRRNTVFASWQRIGSLVKKETRQIIRDPSSIAMGVVMPVMMILLFGYGLSLDVKNVPIAIVLEEPSPDATELAAGFQLSPYFRRYFHDLNAAGAGYLMLRRDVDGIVRLRQDFSKQLGEGNVEVEILVHGTDANRARIIQGYAQGAVAQWAIRRGAERGESAPVPLWWFRIESGSTTPTIAIIFSCPD